MSVSSEFDEKIKQLAVLRYDYQVRNINLRNSEMNIKLTVKHQSFRDHNNYQRQQIINVARIPQKAYFYRSLSELYLFFFKLYSFWVPNDCNYVIMQSAVPNAILCKSALCFRVQPYGARLVRN